MLDLVMEYRRVYGNYPSTWRDFVYGLDHLSRHYARDSIRVASAVRIGQSTDPEAWYDRQSIAAGWV